MDTIRNIEEFAEALGTTAPDLDKYFHFEVYPVTITYDSEKIIFTTDADRVPFSKILRFPFTEDDYEDTITALQCVTDYAMHEGYDHTHKDLFDDLALRYAERHGIYEYTVNKEYMEYWSLYGDGFYFYRVSLNTLVREEVCHLHWSKDEGYPIPSFLVTPEGYTKYNYFEG